MGLLLTDQFLNLTHKPKNLFSPIDPEHRRLISRNRHLIVKLIRISANNGYARKMYNPKKITIIAASLTLSFSLVGFASAMEIAEDLYESDDPAVEEMIEEESKQVIEEDINVEVEESPQESVPGENLDDYDEDSFPEEQINEEMPDEADEPEDIGMEPEKPDTPGEEISEVAQDMGHGHSGEDVRELQKLLNDKGYTVAEEGPGSPGEETDFYGPATEQAVADFQESYSEEILEPLNLEEGTGFLGEMTREKIMELVN